MLAASHKSIGEGWTEECIFSQSQRNSSHATEKSAEARTSSSASHPPLSTVLGQRGGARTKFLALHGTYASAGRGSQEINSEQ